jgi:hypothetical protein
MQYSLRFFIVTFIVLQSVHAAGAIRGYLDQVTYVNGLTVASGWACESGRPESIAVHLYAGGPAGTGNYVNSTTANLPSEPAVAAACGSTGSNYRFQIEIGNYQAQNIAKPIYVHGISITGGANLTIGNSGNVYFPDSIFGNIFGSPIQIRVSAKYAGAIDSLYWRGTHFVDNADHGRQFQLAGQFKGFGECYNPNEAGNFADTDGPTSSSKFQYLSTYKDALSTTNYGAFWLRPKIYGGPPSFYSSPWCTPGWDQPPSLGEAKNTTILSNYRFRKYVTIGFQGIPNVISFHSQVYIPETVTGMQLTTPAGFMPSTFSNFWEYNVSTKSLTRLFAGAETYRSQPVILENPTNNIALGIYAADILKPAQGTTGWFVWGSYPGTSYWWFLHRTPGMVSQGTTVFHNSYLVLGTKSEVTVGFDRLHAYFKSIGQVF